MNRSIRIVVGPVFCSVLLSACGSGDGDGGAGALAQVNVARSIVEKYEAAGETPESSMPTTGTATYKGAAVYSLTEDISGDTGADILFVTDAEIREKVDATSDATLIADFASGSISGSLTNFHVEDGAAAGTVNITNGTITGSMIQGDLSGDIAGIGAVTGDMEGSFHGGNAEAVGAGMTGNAGGTPFWGQLVAEKQ